MSEKQTFEVEVGVSWDGGETVSIVVIDGDTYDYDDIVSTAFKDAKENGGLDGFEHISEDDCKYDIRITDGYLNDIGITNSDELKDFCDVFYSDDNYHDIDVFEAAYACDIPFEDIDECYNGAWDSDEDFVQDLLESTGDLPSDLPHYIHIDWESTARDIMMDYCEHNGHYFRQ
jgi:hypothetical protein